MGDAATGHGAAQRGGDMRLHDQVGKPLGAVFAGKGDHGEQSNAEVGTRNAERGREVGDRAAGQSP